MTDHNARLAELHKQRENALKKDPANTLWRHVRVMQLPNGEPKMKCECGRVLAVSNPSASLTSHVYGNNCKLSKPKRPAEPSDAGTSNAGASGAEPKKQKRGVLAGIAAAMIHLPAPTKTLFKQALMYWALVCSSTLSFNVMAHPLLSRALALLGINPIDRKHLAGAFLDQTYQEKKQQQADRVRSARYVQVALDAWRRRCVNKGFKIVAATFNFLRGASYALWRPTKGESINAEFLKDFMGEALAQAGGVDKCCGFVTDGEAACVKAGADLEEEHPKLVSLLAFAC